MAGMGPPPKDASKRARRNAGVIQMRVVEVEPVSKPSLPEISMQVNVDGELQEQIFVWPEPTRQWWDALDDHPLAHEFIEADWSYLLDTARIHAEFWQGNMKVANELRLREAKYGFTPEDRLRLRIQLASATEREVEASSKVARSVSRQRAQGVKRVANK